ncbi:MAG TPA: transaldolase [Myxococcales bacterium]|nr:transaldolase [Myxococcales bacterium]
MKPAARLQELGQSAWLDLIGRKLIHSGELARMAKEDGIRGVTANPAIFEKAISETNEYDDQLARLVAEGKTALEIYETMAIDDVRAACDALRPWFDKGEDGFVSLEVSPYIARDTRATVAEAKRFWKAVDRPNLFIKIPANHEGIPAIREATAAGISVNITLIFSVKVYEQVIDAYLAGLEERVAKGEPVKQIHSVASFFVSRVDTSVDKLLEAKGVKDLQGKIANANAKEAYQQYLKSIASPRWRALEAKGATRQRPLWASTGTKNKAYSDVLYVEPLIGRDTVNTLPLATLNAFNDHGKVAETVTQGVDEARAQLARLGELGIDLEKVCADLTDQGLDLFSKALDGLLGAIEKRSGKPLPEPALRSQGLAIFTPQDHAQVLRKVARTLGVQAESSPASWISAHIALADPGDKVALQSYLKPEQTQRLRELHGALHKIAKAAPGVLDASYVVQLAAADTPQARSEQQAMLRNGARVLRVVSEDGNPDKLLHVLQEANKQLPKK